MKKENTINIPVEAKCDYCDAYMSYAGATPNCKYVVRACCNHVDIASKDLKELSRTNKIMKIKKDRFFIGVDVGSGDGFSVMIIRKGDSARFIKI